MSNKKMIQINPELFRLSGSKTRKNKEKKELQLTPIVNPNTLKNKLLKRIKEHKTNELKTNKPNKPIETEQKTESYSDEFFGAMDYLSDISKKQKVNQAKQRSMNLKTLKNYHSQTDPNISLELPYELTEQMQPVTSVSYSQELPTCSIKPSDDVPYGCLKGGKKKTYREWKEMNNSVDIPDIVRPPTPPKENTNKQNSDTISREERLSKIRNKLKQLEEQELSEKRKSFDHFKILESKLSKPLFDDTLEDLEDNTVDLDELLSQRHMTIEQDKDKNKQYLKKTIKRKFTLGKSDKLRRVSVLIKDKKTRKNIIDTQKALKKTDVTEVKKYLKQHGLIKAGSTCPVDILRKTFESAVLTGDVTNMNKETLIHNFIHT
jgi:hypothetical protein